MNKDDKLLRKWEPTFLSKMTAPFLVTTFAVLTLFVVLFVLPLWMLKKF